MCGIAGFIFLKNSTKVDKEKLANALLRGIDHRGGDATGMVARNREGIVEWHKASTNAAGFIPFRRPLPVDADVCLLHTRFATQGHEAFPENNHPVKRGPMFVIHNGVVYNDSELFRFTNRTRYGQVDSEALAALMSDAGTLDATGPHMERVDGSAAIAALDERDGTVLLARISDSPLYVLRTRRVILFGSTADSVTNAHKSCIGSLGRAKPSPMSEGDALVIRDGAVSSFTFAPPTWTYIPKRSTVQVAADTTTGSYLPSRAQGNGYLESLGYGAKLNCEICAQPMSDAYDLYDSSDRYEVCEPCFDAYGDGDDALVAIPETRGTTARETYGDEYARLVDELGPAMP